MLRIFPDCFVCLSPPLMKSKVWPPDKIYSLSLCAFPLETFLRHGAEMLSQNSICLGEARRLITNSSSLLSSSVRLTVREVGHRRDFYRRASNKVDESKTILILDFRDSTNWMWILHWQPHPREFVGRSKSPPPRRGGGKRLTGHANNHISCEMELS